MASGVCCGVCRWLVMDGSRGSVEGWVGNKGLVWETFQGEGCFYSRISVKTSCCCLHINRTVRNPFAVCWERPRCLMFVVAVQGKPPKVLQG